MSERTVEYTICGVVRLDNGDIRNIVRNYDPAYKPKKVDEFGKTQKEIEEEIKYNANHVFKELDYLGSFDDEIESMAGFQDLVIDGVYSTSNEVNAACQTLITDNDIRAIIFIDEPKSLLVVTNLYSFSSYLLFEDGTTKPYVASVSTDTFEDEVSDYLEKYPELTM